jgi:hypothetical protein
MNEQISGFDPWLFLCSRRRITSEFVKVMPQVITAKLKLNLTAEQKALGASDYFSLS